MSAPGPSLSPLHRLWRLLPAASRRALFARATAWSAPRPDAVPPPMQGGLAVGGEIGRASGLGEVARLMGHALRSLDVPTWLVDTGSAVPGEVPDAALAAENARMGLTNSLRPGVPLALHVNAPMLPWALRTLPRGLLRGRRVVGCWTWELPLVPESWRVGLDFVHEVWVPSRFTATAMAGLMENSPARAKPIRIVGYPLAASPPVPSRLDRAAFGLPTEAVVVLVSFNLASSFVRKNPLAAIAAFRRAFGPRADRVMVLKLLGTHAYPADMAVLRAAAADAGNIRIETRTLPPADSHALTACADIVLSLHRAEGFGLLPAEAMLLGRAVVATGWSGNMDYMDASTAALVDYRLVPASDPRGTYDLSGAVWAEPDVDAAAGHLVRLADDAALRSALGRRAAVSAKDKLGATSLDVALRGMGWDAMATRRAGCAAEGASGT